MFVSDGAGAIRILRERGFSDAAFVLDWNHAVDHLRTCAVAAFGEGAKADDWFERHTDRLWQGRCDLVIRQIARHSRRLGAPPKSAPDNDPRRVLANNLGYFRANRAGIDYPAFRKNGWPLGSGIVESAIKQLGKRVKGAEKHWTSAGAEQTLQVVAKLISDDHSWEHFWERCPMADAA